MTKIPLDKDNRMLRIGFGKHEGKWFSRIDLWWAGYRFKRKERKSSEIPDFKLTAPPPPKPQFCNCYYTKFCKSTMLPEGVICRDK